MIIVSGARKGLGRTICERLTRNGAEVLGISRSVAAAPYEMRPCDVSSYDQLKELATQLRKHGAVIEAIVNAAGVASMNLAVTTPEAVTRRVIETNLLGTIFCCQLFSPLMMRHKAGSIINFSTIAVALGLKGESVYVASKAGVEGFSRTFAREMADFNIRVNCIAPGPIATDLIRGVSEQQIAKVTEQQILQRQYEPSDVCDVVDVLLDPKSHAITGQVIRVGGA